MGAFESDNSPWTVRDDLTKAYRDYWEVLARPGNWWSGAERVAIARETRNALNCGYCAERRSALSPYNFPGEHEHGGELDPVAVDAVHRIITDQGRITQAWIDGNVDAGLREEQYVELLGIAVTVFSIDEFYHALGLPQEPLPTPVAGEPDHYRPPQARRGTGFVAMLPEHGGAVGSESDLWPDGRSANVLRALSLVPEAVRGWVSVSGAQYLSMQQIMSPSAETGRALNRMQMEIVAGRVSSHNECFY
jgi:hypothetical protein